MTLTDHPDRTRIANELHARPSPRLDAPGQVAYLALIPDRPRDTGAERTQLLALLDRFGAAHPPEGATHHACQIGRNQLRWESHTEFVTYTILSSGLSDKPFDSRDFEVFPQDWLRGLTGRRITSILMRVERAEGDAGLGERVQDWLVRDGVTVSRVLDDQMVIAGDFRIDAAGHMRFAVFARPGTGAGRTGRVIQRLCEIETYKAMAMLGLTEARALGGDLARLDAELSALTLDMTGSTTPPEDSLHRLLEISTELERLGTASAFRFAASAAYETIVTERIEVLRESQFEGRQTFAEFMMRRFDPAMRTVRSTETRLARLSDRALRAADLLRTRVDVERSAQNQALLESMDRRADLQLRLQQTVEGLSVVAISYYALNLLTYLLAPLGKAAGIDKTVLTALCVIPVVLVVWALIRRIRNSMH